MSDSSVRRPGAWLPYAFALAFVGLLSAFSNAAEEPIARVVSPTQSPNDDYAYRLVTLDNGLQALLVSDPETRKAAASLDVMVGSGDNPPGREGLAHFLEHMLFLGTEKYPDAAEYERYITEHGGSRNAYTSFEHTNYFFDIDAAHLDEALDRFAQFFIAPNFDAGYVEREKNAVEAEYQMGLKSDSRRGLDVLQEVMNPRHPFSQFSVGSLETLADRPGSSVRDDLVAFYRKHYSANAMRLVVMGSQPLDELQAMVAKRFVEVPNHDYDANVIDAPLFEPGQSPRYRQDDVQVISGLEKVAPAGRALQLAPNPVRGLLTIGHYTSEAGPIEYRLFSLDGQLLMRSTQTATTSGWQQHQINLRQLQSGSYLLQVTDAASTYSKQVIKQ